MTENRFQSTYQMIKDKYKFSDGYLGLVDLLDIFLKINDGYNYNNEYNDEYDRIMEFIKLRYGIPECRAREITILCDEFASTFYSLPESNEELQKIFQMIKINSKHHDGFCGLAYLLPIFLRIREGCSFDDGYCRIVEFLKLRYGIGECKASEISCLCYNYLGLK